MKNAYKVFLTICIFCVYGVSETFSYTYNEEGFVFNNSEITYTRGSYNGSIVAQINPGAYPVYFHKISTTLGVWAIKPVTNDSLQILIQHKDSNYTTGSGFWFVQVSGTGNPNFYVGFNGQQFLYSTASSGNSYSRLDVKGLTGDYNTSYGYAAPFGYYEGTSTTWRDTDIHLSLESAEIGNTVGGWRENIDTAGGVNILWYDNFSAVLTGELDFELITNDYQTIMSWSYDYTSGQTNSFGKDVSYFYSCSTTDNGPLTAVGSFWYWESGEFKEQVLGEKTYIFSKAESCFTDIYNTGATLNAFTQGVDTNADDSFSISEMFDYMSDSFNKIKNFFGILNQLPTDEINTFSFIPTVSADLSSSIGGGFDNLSNNNSPITKISTFIKWGFIFVVFVMIFILIFKR